MRLAGAFAIAACVALAQTPEWVPVPGAPADGQPFSIARTETTVEQFRTFVNATGYRTQAEQAAASRTWRTPGFRVEPKQPVVYVTPVDAAAYCESLGGRLPTDTEWEYAARAGANTRHYWGDSIDSRYLWYRVNSNDHPHSVARKLPNRWGLYDMEGNVWEWSMSSPVKGEPYASRRGGSWIDCEDIDGGPGKTPGILIGISVAYTVPVRLNHRYDDIGFRCVRSAK